MAEMSNIEASREVFGYFLYGSQNYGLADENSDIDVDWLLYCYTTILKRSEKDFWSSSPAMVFKQLDIHMELNRKASEQQSDKPEKKSSKQTYKVLD